MINNYGFYNEHEKNNTVVIIASDKMPNNKKVNGEVTVLYHDDQFVGYEIADFIRYAKIKYSGIIFLPNKILIDIINNILTNSGLETIRYRNNSGYKIKRNKNGKLGVYAEKGTFLRDYSISEGKFCTYFELYIDVENQHELIEMDEEGYEGKDFFVSKD